MENNVLELFKTKNVPLLGSVNDINFPIQRGLLPYGSRTPNILPFSIITIE